MNSNRRRSDHRKAMWSYVNQSNRNIYICLAIFILCVFFCYKTSQSCDLPVASVSQMKTNNDNHSMISSVHQIVTEGSEDGIFFVFADESPLVRAYIDVVRDTVCGLSLQTQESSVVPTIQKTVIPFNYSQRVKGLDWPLVGITMIGRNRLINIEWALRYVIAHNVPGDFIECGVWRGGGSIFARSVLRALNIEDRHVWVADSFQGLPTARTGNDHDEWSQQEYLKVSLEEVQTNFRSFDLLDDRVHFCKGYFVDALPNCHVSRLAVLRMDGDMYESTMDQLFNLYGKLEVNGVIIIDDYHIPECVRAVADFRRWHKIEDVIRSIPDDDYGRYWIKKTLVTVNMDLYRPLLNKKASLKSR